MDNFKKMAGDAMGSGIDQHLKDIDFPASKDQVLDQLKQKGVPGQILDKVRNVNTDRFGSLDELKSKVGL